MGGGLAAVAAAAVDVPVWLVAGRGRRLPAAFVDAIAGGLAAETSVRHGCVTQVAGPDGVVPVSRDALAAECPAVPELLAAP